MRAAEYVADSKAPPRKGDYKTGLRRPPWNRQPGPAGGEEGITSLVEVGVEEAGAGRLEVDPRVRDRRARLEILVPELGDLHGRDEHSGRLPWRRASPRRRGWRAEPKRWRPWIALYFLCNSL